MQHRFRSLFPEQTPQESPFVQLHVQVAGWQRELYAWAYECAKAVVEPSWVERDVLGAWN